MMISVFLAMPLTAWCTSDKPKRNVSSVSPASQNCIDCHVEVTPGIVSHWEGSRHAEKNIGCFECHEAKTGDADAFDHYDANIAVVVTPLDCARCHLEEAAQFAESHHAKGGNILASLDNFLAETVEGARMFFNPHSPTLGKQVDQVNGMASAYSGCQQCHGGKIGLLATDGSFVTVDDLKPDENGMPTNQTAVQKIARDKEGRPTLNPNTWPNTGIGRLNLDGSRGSCTACHSRHDFSPRRARQPENCGKCHLGPDHPQKEIYEESKHGVAYRDLKDSMNLDSESWVLGKDYSAAPTCATCHMSGNALNGGKVTHDPGERISWTNRPPVSLLMDTDEEHQIVKETDPEKRKALVHDTWQQKRNRMKDVCSHCHTPAYIDAFYKQYDDLVILFNEKFAKAGQKIISVLREQGLITKTDFDEEIEWTWFYLWHHEGRRARHGASMMAPDYTHWHGMYEVADRFYMSLIPQARELAEQAIHQGQKVQGEKVNAVIDKVLARPEHQWFQKGAEDQAARVRQGMRERYGQ
ncbi:MAG: hydroxylamine oxidoreductase [Candidatus Omnitrophica bacterium CG11_big_fil_rev_8_21_14_0_20_45_26]|uniref:Hydroxylamine oxidoreductase n=1 Tax=Candidatus Abzuiibacterium crystallinum TaxID=1974748 RepID=A0A2H0LL19_9BACT|nr:MAG: hydroxylamine oxidoreductase [Candidatus Omnitrophica bacterium CG11_big_fil_rev_8_21_14_0_20_45_26]PIW64004.1 MAG: hydroxylamine oxidoreductase [Candidatus Omnitrophica bacterium CG12_big_fil_rev_8_21_14_0_65_45_16]